MAEQPEPIINFMSLKSADAYAKDILETACHVVHFIFVDDKWENAGTEGVLFVYSRTEEPFHKIVIVNKVYMKNLVVPVTQVMELQLYEQFLIYRNTEGVIFGIWFYIKEECVKIATLLDKIIDDLSESEIEGHTNEAAGYSVSICSMLKKAQEEYNSKHPRNRNPEAFAAPLDSYTRHHSYVSEKDDEPTPRSVVKFFEKACKISKLKKKYKNKNKYLPPFLPSPMFNAAHSVQHIEKQQKAATPQNYSTDVFLNSKQNRFSSNRDDTNNGLSFNIKPVTQNNPSVIPKKQINIGSGFKRISDSRSLTAQTQEFYNHKFKNNLPSVWDGSIGDHINHIENNQPLSAPIETQFKPPLMPPVMFLSPLSKNEDNCDTKNSSGDKSQLVGSSIQQPLNKKQFERAMIYLLKNDEEFLNEMHGAYLNTFADSLT